MATTTIDSFSALAPAAAVAKTQNEAGSADRFLKLLVAQMENQDPLNPMDNAQITSQMAQINTVNGIDKLNTSVEALNAQFAQMQAVQGAALVGHDVTLKGDALSVDAPEGSRAGTGVGGFDLAGTADRVKVEILAPNGRVLHTLELGRLDAGRHGFDFSDAELPADAAGEEPHRFRITATAGSVPVATTPLMRDHVAAVRGGAGGLSLELARSGVVPYGDILAFN